jgi:hypothetical protein
MSDDLVKRLRNLDTHPEGAPRKAADRIEELEAKLQKWAGVLEWLDDDTITRVDWVAGGGDPAGEFCRIGLNRVMPDGTELFRTYVATDEWTPRRPNPFGLGIDGGDA